MGDDESLTINEAFAGKYAHNKGREEVTRARELGDHQKLSELAGAGDGDGSSSSSSSDDEDAELLTSGIDKQISSVLDMIKRGDPAIYDPGAQLYNSDASESSDDDDDGGGGDSSGSDSDSDGSDSGGEPAAAAAKKPKKSKPVTIKDQLRERIMKKMDNDESASDSDSEIEAELTRPSTAAGPTFVEEQAALKKEFGSMGGSSDRLGASLDDSDSDSDGGLFQVRTKTAEEQAEQDATIDASFARMAETQAAKEKAGEDILARAALGDQGQNGFARKLLNGAEAAMEEQTEMDASEFLNDYIMNQRWLDKPSKKRKKRKAAEADGDGDGDSDPDDETLDKFEAAYNFRFEEAAASGGSVDIVGHARRQGSKVELGLARRPDDRRKTKRANKKKRKEVRRCVLAPHCLLLAACCLLLAACSLLLAPCSRSTCH